jgi:hypothetical protein
LDGFTIGTVPLSGYTSSTGMIYFALTTSSVGFILETTGNAVTLVNGQTLPTNDNHAGASNTNGAATNLTMCNALLGLWCIFYNV